MENEEFHDKIISEVREEMNKIMKEVFQLKLDMINEKMFEIKCQAFSNSLWKYVKQEEKRILDGFRAADVKVNTFKEAEDMITKYTTENRNDYPLLMSYHDFVYSRHAYMIAVNCASAFDAEFLKKV